ncbi:MAG: hypothetical protein Q9167_003689, partial [Letrouitia subvulpina]
AVRALGGKCRNSQGWPLDLREYCEWNECRMEKWQQRAQPYDEDTKIIESLWWEKVDA